MSFIRSGPQSSIAELPESPPPPPPFWSPELLERAGTFCRNVVILGGSMFFSENTCCYCQLLSATLPATQCKLRAALGFHITPTTEKPKGRCVWAPGRRSWEPLLLKKKTARRNERLTCCLEMLLFLVLHLPSSFSFYVLPKGILPGARGQHPSTHPSHPHCPPTTMKMEDSATPPPPFRREKPNVPAQLGPCRSTSRPRVREMGPW